MLRFAIRQGGAALAGTSFAFLAHTERERRKLVWRATPLTCKHVLCSERARSSQPAHGGLLADAWTTAAAGYADHLAPRFSPWFGSVVQELAEYSDVLPTGPIFVPACGPAFEVPLISASPCGIGRNVVACDISVGMIEAARRHLMSRDMSASVDLAVGDATSPSGSYALILSFFGLQQMPPSPRIVLARWCEALQPGGLCAVCFWEQQAEISGPWKILQVERANLLASMTGASVGSSSSSPEDVFGDLDLSRFEVLIDKQIHHDIHYDSALDCWRIMAEHGPVRAVCMKHGAFFTACLRDRFLANFDDISAPLVHCPAARFVVVRRLQQTRSHY